jgi:hypothetical protein
MNAPEQPDVDVGDLLRASGRDARGVRS